MPALATSTSTGPNSCSTAVKAAATSSADVTSHCTPYSPSGAPLPRWVTATRSPLAAKACAMARPIPRLPPVTRTVLPPVRPLPSSTHPTLVDRKIRPRGSAVLAGTVGSTVGLMRAIQLTEFGGPETLVVSEVADPVAAEGQEVFDVVAAGVNYADTHQTEDSYLAKQQLPLIPVSEVVVRGADGARLLGLVGNGGYAEKIAIGRRSLIPVPDAVSDAAALTTLVQGATAWHLLRTSTHLQPGESVVVHAGAGGVGTIAIQLAQRWGAGRVIATESSEEKR